MGVAFTTVTTSFGFPLASHCNHYVSIELLGAFDSVDIPTGYLTTNIK